MYERFFGLRERPFDLTPNPRFLVMTDGHREALSNLEYAIASRKGITLLLGEAGCGKTTVIRAAIERQPSRVHCVHITNPALTREEFVEILAAQFGLSHAARRSKAGLLLELEPLLRRRHEAGETTVLVIDEAQSLPDHLLEEIRLLANIETSDDKLVSLILAGQPELSEQLNQESLRQLKQRIALRCELRPLTAPETLAYLAGRLRAAGGVAARIFTREAAMLLHEHSAGVPRLVNVLADNALLASFGQNKAPVTSAMVAEIARDFNLKGTGDDNAPASTEEIAGAEDLSAGEAAQPPSSLIVPVPADAPAIERTAPESEPEQPRDEDIPSATVRFGTFSARRRFPFLGRGGTA